VIRVLIPAPTVVAIQAAGTVVAVAIDL
jgi:hypothetical protein